jgi:hypothetical protein
VTIFLDFCGSSELPGKYASALSTPFEKEVTAGTNDFELVD